MNIQERIIRLFPMGKALYREVENLASLVEIHKNEAACAKYLLEQRQRESRTILIDAVLLAKVKTLLIKGQKIQALKELRNGRPMLGLLNAKHAVGAIQDGKAEHTYGETFILRY